MTLIFPTILILLDIGAALAYAAAFNWKMAIYWIAAAVLTGCITY